MKAFNGDFTLARFYVLLIRKARISNITLLVPAVILSYVSLLFVLLPREGSDRVTFLVGILFVYFTLMVALNDKFPPTEKVPAIAYMFGGHSITILLLIILALLLRFVYNQSA
jgi:hypothetical protein